MTLNTVSQNPNTNRVIPAGAQDGGIDRGSCSWFERPMSGNNLGDRLQIVDMGFCIVTWTGKDWGNPTVHSQTNPLTGRIALSGFDEKSTLLANTEGYATIYPDKLVSPASIAGLTHWFDAQGPMYTAAYGKICDTIGDAVAIWPNGAKTVSSGNLSATGTVSYAPLGINGKPAVNCAGTGYFASATADLGAAFNNALTVFVVCQATDAQLSGNPIVLSAQPATGNFWLQALGGSHTMSVSNAGATPSGPSLSLPANGFNGILTYSVGVSGASPLQSPVTGFVLGFGGPSAELWQPVSGSPGSSCATMQAALTAGGMNFSAAPTGNMGKLIVGNLYGGGFNWTGMIGEVLVYNAALTVQQIGQVYDYLNAKWYGTAPANVICVGDSLTSGTGSTTGASQACTIIGDNYPSLLWSKLGETYRVLTDAYPGRYTSTLFTETPTFSQSLRQPISAVKNIVVVWSVTNTLNATNSVRATYDQLMRYCKTRQSLGEQVVVLTCLARGDGSAFPGFEKARLALNALIRQNFGAFADGLADVDLDSRL